MTSDQRAPMDTYGAYAKFYDATQGVRREVGCYVRLIEKHHPAAVSLLEIACGTGALLAQFAKRYEVTGLDVSQAMLRIARKRLPGVRLHRQSMAGFELDRRFDVIVCLYDSINHLLTFDEWVETFRAAERHLDPGGVFLFDVNTEHKLETLASAPPYTLPFEDHYMIMKVAKARSGAYAWEIKIFEHVLGARYRLHHDLIQERAYPHQRVLGALRSIFPVVRAFDQNGLSRPKRATKSLLYVCQVAPGRRRTAGTTVKA